MVKRHEDPPRRSRVARLVDGSAALRRAALPGISVAAVVLEHGFHAPPLPTPILRLAALIAFSIAAADACWWCGTHRSFCIRVERILAGFGAAAVAAWAVGVAPAAWSAFEWVLVLLFLLRCRYVHLALAARMGAVALLIVDLLALIVVGTLLIKAPGALDTFAGTHADVPAPVGGRLFWVDAVFTMTGAVCLTGLRVRDAAEFSPFGQSVLALFMQLGGVRIALFGSMLLLHGAPGRIRGRESVERFARVAALVVTVMLTAELIGAALMVPLWSGPMPWPQRVAWSLFHAISAFCNAGLVLQPEALSLHVHVAHGVIGPLVFAGGLGIPVIAVLWLAARRRAARWAAAVPLLPHAKIVVATSVALYLVGTVGLAAAQMTAGRPASSALADAGLMSLTCRSAGFSTIRPDRIEPAGQGLLTALMLIGASPASTGGGMKTTALALLWIAAVAAATRRPAVACGLPVDGALIRRAAHVAGCQIGLFLICAALLVVSEPFPFNKLVFESAGAASTAGLSLGVTPQLTPFGKAVIIATMILGRLGPPVLVALMLSERAAQARGAVDPVRLG